MIARSLSHRAPLLFLALPYAAGIAVQRSAGIGGEALLLVAAGVLAVASIGVACRQPSLECPAWFALPAGALFLAGAIAGLQARQVLAAWKTLPPREVRLQLRLTRVFHSADPSRLSGIGSVVAAPSTLRELDGQRVFVTAPAPPGPDVSIPSSVLLVTGLLSSIRPDSPPGSFEAYLADSGVNFRILRGRVLSLREPPGRYAVFCARSAERLATILGFGIADRRPDLTGVYRATLLGWQSELTDEQKDLFILSGTMHLFSVSGLHVVVISVGLNALLAAIRVPRPAAAFGTIIIVGLHVAITGASPAAVRAFLLVLFQQSAHAIRQPSNGVAALAFASLVVLLGDPLALFSASFQMSYGAVLAILVYGIPLGEVLAGLFMPDSSLPRMSRSNVQKMRDFAIAEVCKAIGVGLSATLVGTITGITYFRVFAPISLVVNLAVIPIASFAIHAGAAAIACGLVGFAGGSSLFNNSAATILWVVDKIVRGSVGIPGGWWAAEWRAPWAGPVALVLLFAALLGGCASGWRTRYGGYLQPIVLTTVIILLGAKVG